MATDAQHDAQRTRSEGWRLGTIAGVPVLLARSWLLIALVVTVVFAQTVQATDPGLGVVAAHAVAFTYAVLLALSVLVHEVAHALSARACGMPPSRIVLTLWGGHTSFESEARAPAASFAVAAAGPASNGVLAVGAFGAMGLLDLTPVPALLLYVVALSNGLVAVTNVLPGLPLDGGRMLEAVVWHVRGDRDAGTVVAAWAGRAVAVGVPVLVALLWATSGQRPSVITLAWAAMVGALLWSGAGAELQSARIRRRAPGASVAALARHAIAVDARSPLSVALAVAGEGAHRDLVVLVDDDGAPLGVLDHEAAATVPADRRAVVRASAAQTVLGPGAVLPLSLGGTELLRALPSLPPEPWVVVDEHGRVRGVLRSEDVVAAVVGR